VAAVVDVRDAFCLHPVPGGAVAALRGLTLRVEAGERVVVHGPNGSGKTTLLRVLAGEQQLSAGRAVVAGADVTLAAAPAGWRATDLGWVDQHAARTLRPELDVLDNVALQQRLAGVPAAAARVAARSMLERLGVGGLAGRRVTALSGGEAQRVAVCAALAHGPRLVLADEPTGELDAVAADAVYDALAGAVAAAGAALVLVSHDPRAARVADRVVRIRDGRLSETWSPLHPGGGPTELLVVDDRGWLRLPEPLRRAANVLDTVAAEQHGDTVVLSAPSSRDHAERCGPEGPAPDAPVHSRRVAHDHEEGAVVAELVGVGKSYRGRGVLVGVDLAVRAGGLLVVRGRSGSGKSTLLRVLVGLERPDTGRALLGGRDLSGLDRSGLARARRELAAVAGQDAQLADTLDAAANLELARAVRGLPADPEGDRLRLAELGLAPLADRQVRLLSGGERARVAVARALAVRPALLVLDEPTAQLDEASAEELAHVLVRAARQGAAVIVATHDPVLVAAADLVRDLDPGPGEAPQSSSTTTGA
jgi:ABC-type lipoprotein export system ATPase subunit